MNGDRIAIGSRGSALALAQARLVSEALERDGRRTRVVIVETEGDRRAPDTAWGEGAFVAAIERALLDGRVDVAVHSAKDVPIEQDARLRIAAYLPRADPRDALVVRADATEHSLSDLRPGTRVGTDSPRRAGFIRARRPDLVVHPLHGNVDTRLRRLDAGETDALVLACAGLDRLDLGGRIAERLSPEVVPPAPGQGAIAIQVRRDDARMVGLTAAIDDARTRAAVEAERAFLEASGGGCRAPIGALATIAGGELDLLVGHATPDGSTATVAHRTGPAGDGRRLALELAAEVLPATRVRGRAARVLVTRATGQSRVLVAALREPGPRDDRGPRDLDRAQPAGIRPGSRRRVDPRLPVGRRDQRERRPGDPRGGANARTWSCGRRVGRRSERQPARRWNARASWSSSCRARRTAWRWRRSCRSGTATGSSSSAATLPDRTLPGGSRTVAPSSMTPSRTARPKRPHRREPSFAPRSANRRSTRWCSPAARRSAGCDPSRPPTTSS